MVERIVTGAPFEVTPMGRELAAGVESDRAARRAQADQARGERLAGMRTPMGRRLAAGVESDRGRQRDAAAAALQAKLGDLRSPPHRVDLLG